MTKEQLDAIRARVEAGHRHQGCCAVEARENLRALLAEVERLTAERDALIRWRDGWLAADEAYENIRIADAFKRGVEAMREAAAKECRPMLRSMVSRSELADDIRSLPDPEDK